MNVFIEHLNVSPIVKTFLFNLTNGDITLISGFFWLFVAALFSTISGAIGGIILEIGVVEILARFPDLLPFHQQAYMEKT